jgi:hypothetical protein
MFNVGDLVIHADDKREHKTIGVVSKVVIDSNSQFGDILKVEWLNDYDNNGFRFRARNYRAIALAKINKVS